MFDGMAGKDRDQFGELADSQPNDFVDERSQCRISFSFETDSEELSDAQAARLPGKYQRQGSVAGDDAQGFNGVGHVEATLTGKEALATERREGAEETIF
jgi:hypothetical protein